MRRNFLVYLLILLSISTMAQIPEGITYQAILRDTEGNSLINKSVDLTLALHIGSPSGTTVYSETYVTNTSQVGMINAIFGSQNLENFQNIDWSEGPYFISVSVDGISMGSTQLLTVPYAYYAKTAESVERISYGEIENAPSISDSVYAIINSEIIGTNYTKAEIDSFLLLRAEIEALSRVAFSGRYNDLTDAPTVPSNISELVNDLHFLRFEVDPAFERSAANEIDFQQIALWDSISNAVAMNYSKEDLDSIFGLLAVSEGLNAVAFSGSYNDLNLAPQYVSEFINDAGYIKEEYDSIFLNSIAASIGQEDTSRWNSHHIDTIVVIIYDTVVIDSSVTQANVQESKRLDALEKQMEMLNGIVQSIGLEGFVTDVDANVYPIKRFGDKFWTIQNLRTTHYADGTAIPRVQDSELWFNQPIETKAYAYFDTTGSNVSGFSQNNFGMLYTWSAITGGEIESVSYKQGICPEGWHLPSLNDYMELISYLSDNGFGIDGSGTDIAKSIASQSSWIGSSTPGTSGYQPELNNSTKFSMEASGNRNSTGEFIEIGKTGYLWTSSEMNGETASAFTISFDNQIPQVSEINKKAGLPVRCVK